MASSRTEYYVLSDPREPMSTLEEYLIAHTRLGHESSYASIARCYGQYHDNMSRLRELPLSLRLQIKRYKQINTYYLHDDALR